MLYIIGILRSKKQGDKGKIALLATLLKVIIQALLRCCFSLFTISVSPHCSIHKCFDLLLCRQYFDTIISFFIALCL